MLNNRTWLAFANRKRCRHTDAIHSLGFINWRMGRARFSIGDIVAQWKFSGDKHKSLQVYTERTFHLRYPLVML